MWLIYFKINLKKEKLAKFKKIIKFDHHLSSKSAPACVFANWAARYGSMSLSSS